MDVFTKQSPINEGFSVAMCDDNSMGIPSIGDASPIPRVTMAYVARDVVEEKRKKWNPNKTGLISMRFFIN